MVVEDFSDESPILIEVESTTRTHPPHEISGAVCLLPVLLRSMLLARAHRCSRFLVRRFTTANGSYRERFTLLSHRYLVGRLE
jgi:hypothetical protein